MNKIFALLISLYVLSKVLFNNEGDAKGDFVTNNILYLNAFFTILFLVLIFLSKEKKLKYNFSGLYGITFIYYIFCLISSIYSNIIFLSFYNSVCGILYTISSLVLGEKIIKNNYSLEMSFNCLINFLYLFSFFAILANMYFFYAYRGENDFIKNGVSSGFIALLILYLSFVLFVHNTNIYRKIMSIFLFLITIKLNSFSAFLSFGAMIIFYFFMRKRYLLILISSVFIYLATISFLSYLDANIGVATINNKPAEAYMTGSGRFILYETAFKIYINEYDLREKIFGVGFMAERSVLLGHDLPWITDPHNAFVLNVLGLGLIGVIIYFIFIFYPFFFIKTSKRIIN